MKFIEINDATTVNMDKIEWIQSHQQGFGCIVGVAGREYPCDIPYKTLIGILQNQEGDKLMQKMDNVLSAASFTAV